MRLGAPRVRTPRAGSRAGEVPHPRAGTTLDFVPARAGPSRLGVQGRLFLLQAVVVTLLTLALAATEVYVIGRRAEAELGERALGLSRVVADLPEVVGAIERSLHPAALINPLANRIRRRAGADFIVVGNARGIRLSHPRAALVGKSMLDRDNHEPAADTTEPLAGHEIVVVARGSLGLSIRAKVPIRGSGGRVIGLVSTGYLLPAVRTTAVRVSRSIWPWFGLSLALALLSSVVISRRFRREMLDLEPEQVSALVLQHRAVLSALQEGVLVLDGTGRVLIANPRAARMLGLNGEPATVREAWPQLAESGLLAGGPGVENEALWLGRTPVLASVLEAEDGRRVVTFRDRAEITRVAEELTQSRRYADLLRAQAHEFMNRLHTVAGLIQLGQSEAALALLHHEADEADEVTRLVADLGVPHLAALVVGKYERARELGVHFGLEPGSRLGAVWNRLAGDVLVPAVGNLLENAFEAVLECPRSGERRVVLMVGEDPDGLQIEVRDSGPGLSPALGERVFERGVSTRGAGRGLGLGLVRERVAAVGGTVLYLRQGGLSVFQVSLPIQVVSEGAE